MKYFDRNFVVICSNNLLKIVCNNNNVVHVNVIYLSYVRERR